MTSNPHLVPPRYPTGRLFDDPDFIRASDWLSSESERPRATVLGAPYSELSISKARCDLLPEELRKALGAFSTYSASYDIDLSGFPVNDEGDVGLANLSPEDSLDRIQEVVADVASSGPLVVIGGDNSISAPAMLGSVGTSGGLITLDAHHDLRDYQRDGLTNGSPVRVLLDEGLSGKSIWQLGIQDFVNARAYSDLASAQGIEVRRISEVREQGMDVTMTQAIAALSGTEGIYVDFDIDVLDRALAPGAPAAQPGGLSPSELFRAAYICGTHPKVAAIDIVEVDPSRDVAGVTVRIAALVLLSFLAGVAKR